MKTTNQYFRIIFLIIAIIQISSCTEDTVNDTSDITGQAMFWVASDLGVGSITVYCNGTNRTISSYYSSEVPSCGASGAANFTLDPGTYSISASGGSKTWNGSITVTSGGCSKIQLTNNGGVETGGNLSLNGKWSDSESRIITISGSSGAFNSFGTSIRWKSAVDKGFVKVGDLYLRNIANVNTTKWNTQILWIAGFNDVVTAVEWGTEGTILLSTDGNTFTLTGISPFSGSSGSASFTRIN